MPGSTECIVSAGSGIQVQWSQIPDGSINFSIRLIADARRPREHHKSKSLVSHSESCKNNNKTIQFQFASGHHSRNRLRKKPKAGDVTIGAEDEDLGPPCQGRDRSQESQGEDDEDDQNEDDWSQSADDQREDDWNSQSEGAGDDTQLTSLPGGINRVTRVPCEVCQNIRGKIEKEFGKRRDRVRKCHSVWMKTPGEFFGNIRFISSEQWSFRALTDSEKKLDRERTPFHKINLAHHLQGRVEQSKLPELNCRKTMLQEIYPGFEKMQRKEKDPLYRRFERYIEQGQALILISKQNDGLLLTIASILSRAEYLYLLQLSITCLHSPD